MRLDKGTPSVSVALQDSRIVGQIANYQNSTLAKRLVRARTCTSDGDYLNLPRAINSSQTVASSSPLLLLLLQRVKVENQSS